MKILKLIGFVVLFVFIFISAAYSAQETVAQKIESNAQVSVLQTQKKTTILNRLEKDGLILTEVKKLRKDKQDDVVCLALNIYNEARGSTVKDQIASSYVVFNRYEDNNYPLTLAKRERNICNIVFDRWQFCWTNGPVIPLPKEKEAWKKAQNLALELYTNPKHRVLANKFALQHYVVTPLVTQKGRPKWIDNRTIQVEIGAHSYMSLKKGIDADAQRINSLSAINEAYDIITEKSSEQVKPFITKIK